mgnify:CR=1 FL=1
MPVQIAQRKAITTSELTKCPECGSKDLVMDNEVGELFCKSCSAVIDESLVDLSAEFRKFEAGEGDGIIRTGVPFDPRVANNLGTTIGNSSDIAKLNSKSKALISRLKRRQTWATTSYEQNIANAMNFIRLVAGKLGLPERVEKEAAMIYRQVALKGLASKRGIESLAVASLLIASKRHTIPRRMKEFSEAAKIEMKVLGKCYKLILRELNMRLVQVSPAEYIQKYVYQLGLSPKTQVKAIKIYEQLEKQGLTSGLSPLSIAGSVIYIAIQLEGEKRTQNEIAAIAGITETTLRNRAKDICDKLNIKLQI